MWSAEYGVWIRKPHSALCIPHSAFEKVSNKMEKSDGQKKCFGILDEVFPMGNQGFREISSDCWNCREKQPCLQAALNTERGLEVRSDALKRSSESGFVGRLKRWSEKKQLSRLKKLQKGERK